jgi:hypothetical protein
VESQSLSLGRVFGAHSVGMGDGTPGAAGPGPVKN